MRTARLGLCCLLLALGGASLSAAPPSLAPSVAFPSPLSSPTEYAPGRLIVKLSPSAARALVARGAVPATLAQAMRAVGVQQAEPLYRGFWSSPTGAPLRAMDKLAALRARYPERAARAGQTVVSDLENTLLLHLFPQADVLAAAEALRRDPEVIWASPDWRVTLDFTPNDPDFVADHQWGLLAIAAPAAWDITLGGSNVVIGLVDTGVKWDHPDLADKIWMNPDEIPGNGVDDDLNGYVDDIRGWDFGDGDADPMDDVVGHGTMCAGVAAAATNNAIGIAGAAPNCPILAVKSADAQGVLWTSAVSAGIVYATDSGASVISLSLGGYGMEEAVDYALAAGVVVVAAAGNYGQEAMSSPAARVGVVAVGASVDNPADPRVDFPGWWASNWGAGLDVLAPGHSILATSLDDPGYNYGDGTSFAAPLIAGAAALIISEHPTLTREHVRRALRASAVPGATGLWDRDWGAGVANAARALAIAQVPQLSLTNPRPQREFVFSDPPPYLAAQDVPVVAQGTLAIKGTVGGPGLASYSLSYSRGYDPDPATRVVLREGTEPVSGTLAALDTTALAPGVYNVDLAATSTEGHTFQEWALFYTDPSQRPGWPVPATAEWLLPDSIRVAMGPFQYPPTLVDLDGDGAAEILQESRAFRADGTVLPAWDQYEPYGTFSYSVAGDLDGDGRPEVIYQDFWAQLQARRGDGSPLPGWYVPSGGQWASASTADLDQDGKDEIILSYLQGASTSATGLYVLRADGSTQPGWPFAREGFGPMWPPAVADADADGALEIAWPVSFPSQLYLFRADGQVESGWPVTTVADALGQPTLADLDADGHMEILLACNDATVRAWRDDGTPLPGWPVSLFDLPWNPPAVGDINGDGSPEVAIGSLDGRVYVWRGNGTPLPGWPVATGPGAYTHCPVIGDVDDDGQREVVIGTLGRGWDHPDIADWARIHALRADGAEVPGYPKEVIGGVTSLAFGDIDGDGKAELAAALYATALAVWDLETPYRPARFPWPMTCATSSHRGAYQPPPHAIEVTCGAPVPAEVESAGAAQLSVTAEDSLAHDLAFSWSDNGAGGAFAPSAGVQSPVYTAPPNAADTSAVITLTAAVTCAGPQPATAHDSTTLTVRPVAHTLTVEAAADPGTVTSGGTTALHATAVDSRGHAVAWLWSDGGAGGSFSPSPTAPEVSYTAPANLTDGDLTITLTATAICAGPQPLTASDTASLVVQPNGHALTVEAAADTDLVASGGAAALTASAVDQRGHNIASWSWSDGGAGGSFSPTAAVPNPTYTAPANPGDGDLAITLTVTATCDSTTPVTGEDSVTLTVQPVAHALTVEAEASPDTLFSHDTAALSALTTDSRGHTVAWLWSDGGAGGEFTPSPTAQSPSYRAPVNCTAADRTVALTVTATCGGPTPASTTAAVNLTVQARADFGDVPFDHWAFSFIESCFSENIVQGYWDGYRPDQVVTRDQMAVYIARAVAGGDAAVPDDTDGAAFTDVGEDHWAYRYIEYCAAHHLVQGFWNGAYQPERVVTRDQMAVYIARAAAGGDDQVPQDQDGTPSFSDVASGHWAYRYVEYCAARGIVQGYWDGYHPEREVTRDQMAVYVQRAFGLPM